MNAQPQEDVLEEALRITKGSRNEDYGPPDKDFAKTAKMWEAILQECVDSKGQLKIKPRHVAMCMIAVKLSREVNSPKRDNSVDIAGYARCLALCQEAEANARINISKQETGHGDSGVHSNSGRR